MAQNTNVRVQITGDSSSAERAFRSATKSAQVMERQLERQRQAMDRTGAAMAVGAAAIVAGFTVAARAAISWESAFAGGRKTVDGTPEQLAAVEAGLRGMARALPATHQELAAVAEAAGQLGVETPAILAFTRVMVDLGETTNLTADEAATSLARLANIMGTDIRTEIDNLGSTLVALGNAGASTERDILEMGLRIAGAGRQIGLTESQVLGFANALSSVGIEAEAGGTAISTTFVTIEKAVRAGGEDLEAFASVAGMTAEQFATAYREDAGSAITTFIEGLDRVSQSGGNTFQILDDLGLGGIRVRDSLLRASSAGDLLRESLDLGAASWEENNALVDEAIKRYNTTEAAVQRARNSINDAGISLGQTFLPAIGEAADTVSAFAGIVGDLPPKVSSALAGVGTLAVLIGGVGGAALIAYPRVVAFNASLAATGPAGAAAAGGLRAVGAALAGPWGIALAAAIGLIGKFTADKIEQRKAVDEVAQAVDVETQALTDQGKAIQANKLQQEGLLETASKFNIETGLLTEAVSGNKDALEEVNASLERRRDILASQDLNGEAMEVVQFRNAINDMAQTTDLAVTEATELNAALEGTEGSAAGASEGVADAAGSMGEMGLSAEEAAGLVDDLDSALQDLLGSALGVQEATDATDQAIADLAETTRTAREEGIAPLTESIYANTQAGRDNREGINAAIESIAKEAKTRVEQGESIQSVTARLGQSREALVAEMVAMGYTRAEALEYTAALDEIPALVQTTVTTPGLGQALTNFGGLEQVMARVDGRTITVGVRDLGAVATAARANVAQADGGIWVDGQLTAAANGLIRDPMIARGGSNIIWAEPETHGESYIPHAPSKRARSLDLWAETGRILGADMGRRLEVNVQTDGTEAAERIASTVVRRQQESEAIRRAWSGDR